jgi:CO/xanthine dehydrogenase FAD-binding subunit
MSATFVSAATLDQALEAVASGARPVAGGTDLVVGARQGKAPLPEWIVAIDRLDELREVRDDGDALVLGTLVTHEVLVADPIVRERLTALADASAIIGSHATRAQGTIGGNVMNASPAMDTGAPLLCFGTTATLRSPAGERSLSLDELWTGPGSTSARPDELLTSLRVPLPPAGTGSSYVRLEYRRQMEIAVVGVAAVATFTGAAVTDARVAITALTPVIVRVPDAEAALAGSDGGTGAVGAAGAAAAAAASPISDVRGSADYRRAMADVIARRAIDAAIRRGRGGLVPIPASAALFSAVGGASG